MRNRWLDPPDFFERCLRERYQDLGSTLALGAPEPALKLKDEKVLRAKQLGVRRAHIDESPSANNATDCNRCVFLHDHTNGQERRHERTYQEHLACGRGEAADDPASSPAEEPWKVSSKNVRCIFQVQPKVAASRINLLA